MKRILATWLAAFALGAFAQLPPPPQAELDQLLAPVALYPDPLLAQVLAAATYPLEVVALERWLEQHSDLAGDALQSAVAAGPWDDSVKALAPFRSVVAMMDGELEWTQRLGDAFLADEAGVMDAVQRLRAKARAQGTLIHNDRTRIVEEDGAIAIEPAAPDVIYVPVYDPGVVYGTWWWPDRPPYAWGAYYWGPWDYVAGGLYFGLGIRAGATWRAHWSPDWHGHDLVRRNVPGRDVWRHEPAHRGGVPYTDPRSRDRYHPPARNPADRREFRGFDVPPRATAPRGNAASPRPEGARPQGRPPQSPRTSPFAPAPQAVARQQADRGRQSLGSRPAPSSAARPAPSGASRPAPSGGGHSGSAGKRPSR